MGTHTVKEKTIEDFGEQWNIFTENEGYYASQEVLEDILGPILSVGEIQGKKVCEIGSGTGRIVNMLAEADAAEITAIEPSQCFEVLKKNTAAFSRRIKYLKVSGENVPEQNFDIIFSIGVIHHIPDPEEVIKSAFKGLKEGGKFFIWVYGREGNELYLFFYKILSLVTKRIPNVLLVVLSWLLVFPLTIYGFTCKFFKLPMHKYMVNHINKLTFSVKQITIFDQLNPAWAKYYTRDEAIDLLKSQSFQNIEIYHRHGYSWALSGTK